MTQLFTSCDATLTSPLEMADLELGFPMDGSIWAKGPTSDVAVWCHRTVSYIAAMGHTVTVPLREDKPRDICTIGKMVSWILTGMADGH